MENIDPQSGEVFWESPVPVSSPKIRTRYNYDRNVASIESGLLCVEPTKTQQQFREECDINTIVKNFGVTGELPNIDRIPLDADFYDLTNYQEALHALMEADNVFSLLPSGIRRRFDNDPAAFVAFASNPANQAELDDMGLGRPKTAPPAPLEVRVIPDPLPTGENAPRSSKQSVDPN